MMKYTTIPYVNNPVSRILFGTAMVPFLDGEWRKRVNEKEMREDFAMSSEYLSSVAQIAMAWMFGQAVNTFAVVSTSSADRMRKNIEAMEIELTPEEMSRLDLSEFKTKYGLDFVQKEY